MSGAFRPWQWLSFFEAFRQVLSSTLSTRVFSREPDPRVDLVARQPGFCQDGASFAFRHRIRHIDDSMELPGHNEKLLLLDSSDHDDVELIVVCHVPFRSIRDFQLRFAWD